MRCLRTSAVDGARTPRSRPVSGRSRPPLVAGWWGPQWLLELARPGLEVGGRNRTLGGRLGEGGDVDQADEMRLPFDATAVPQQLIHEALPSPAPMHEHVFEADEAVEMGAD